MDAWRQHSKDTDLSHGVPSHNHLQLCLQRAAANINLEAKIPSLPDNYRDNKQSVNYFRN